jgi:hypothetical protein
MVTPTARLTGSSHTEQVPAKQVPTVQFPPTSPSPSVHWAAATGDIVPWDCGDFHIEVVSQAKATTGDR